VIKNAWQGEHLGLADRVANPGTDCGGKIGRQLVKPTMRLNEQVQSAQLFEHSARPADTGELSRNGPQHPGDSRGLGIDQARSHGVEVGITHSFQTRHAATYLIAEPLVEFVEPGGYPLSTGCRPFGRGCRIG
jgi:hypothetical protein